MVLVSEATGLKAKKKGGRLCAAPNCHNRYCNSNVSQFRFPKDNERYKIVVFEVSYEIHFLYQEYHISKRQRYQNCNCEF